MKRKTLVPWRGLSATLLTDTPWAAIPEEMNKMFENFLASKPVEKVSSILSKEGLWSKDGASFEPTVDVEEHLAEIVVRVELPGMKEGDVELLLNNDVLTIRGEKKTERKEDGYYESRHGTFERIVPLGVEIVTDKVEAAMKDGVLTIRLPKAGGAREESKKISIKVAQ